MKSLLELLLNAIASISSVVLVIALIAKLWTDSDYDVLLNRIIATSTILLIASFFFFGRWCYSPDK